MARERETPHWPPFGALSKPSSMPRYPIPPREFSTFGAGQHKHQQTPRRRRFWLLLTQEEKYEK